MHHSIVLAHVNIYAKKTCMFITLCYVWVWWDYYWGKKAYSWVQCASSLYTVSHGNAYSKCINESYKSPTLWVIPLSYSYSGNFILLFLPTESPPPPDPCVDPTDTTLEFINESPRVVGSILLVELTVGAAYAAVNCAIGSESLDCMLLLYLKL